MVSSSRYRFRIVILETSVAAATSTWVMNSPDSRLAKYNAPAAEPPGCLPFASAFDHTLRFAYGVNAIQGNDQWPTVAYWEGRADTVDFVFKIDGTPVPVALAYQPPVADKREVLAEFVDAYDTSFGMLVIRDTISTAESVQLLDGRVLQVPYWLYLLLC